MAKVLTIIMVLALTVAGYLILSSRDQGETNEILSSADSSWRSFTADNGSFTVSLPSLPQQAEDTISDPATGEPRLYTMYVAKQNNGSIFMISVISYKTKQLSQAILESVKNEMIASHPGNRLLSSANTSFLEHDAVDFSIENPDAHIEGRAFLVDSTLYLLTHVASKEDYKEEEFTRFVHSFQLHSNKA